MPEEKLYVVRVAVNSQEILDCDSLCYFVHVVLCVGLTMNAFNVQNPLVR